MTLAIMDMLRDEYAFHCLLPGDGPLCQALRQRGIPYTLLGNQRMPAGVKGIGVIPRYGLLSAKAIWNGMRVIRRFRPDVLYAPGPAALPWSAVCGALAKKPVVWHLHHMFLDRMTLKLINFTAGFSAVRRIVAVSRTAGAQITSPKAAAKVTALHNPIDAAAYQGGNAAAVFAEFPALGALKARGALVIGVIAALQPAKRQDVALETAAALRRLGRETAVVLIGGERDGNGAYHRALAERAAALGLSDHAFFLGQRQDIANLLAALDVLMVASIEGFSLAALEAMAAGVPVAAADEGGAAELVKESGGGVLFPYGDAGASAESILRMTRGDWKGIAEKGRAYAEASTKAAYLPQIRQAFEQGRIPL